MNIPRFENVPIGWPAGFRPPGPMLSPSIVAGLAANDRQFRAMADRLAATQARFAGLGRMVGGPVGGEAFQRSLDAGRVGDNEGGLTEGGERWA